LEDLTIGTLKVARWIVLGFHISNRDFATHESWPVLLQLTVAFLEMGKRRGDRLGCIASIGEINNRILKEIVEKMAKQLAASSIRDCANIVKAVVAAAIDENGEQLFPRKWNDEYIDAPLVEKQNQPSTTS
jgi:hypothetical protein